MESLYLLVPIGIIFVVLALKLLFWAVNNGQYDDLDTEGHRILFDDESIKAPAPTAVKDEQSTSEERAG